MSIDFSAEFDSESKALLGKFANLGAHLAEAAAWRGEVQSFGSDLAQAIQSTASSAFTNGTGELAGSFEVTMTGTGAEIGSNIPWARRREFGFSGMTDSLGRFYPNDPGKFYVAGALSQLSPEIPGRFTSAIGSSIAEALG